MTTAKINGNEIVILNRTGKVDEKEYKGETGRILLVCNYKTRINKEQIVPALDLDNYVEYMKPLKALQSMLHIKAVLEEIEKEPLKATKETQRYSFNKLMSSMPMGTTALEAKGPADGTIRFWVEYNSAKIAMVSIGPRGGLKYQMEDTNKFFAPVFKTFDSMIKLVVAETMTKADVPLRNCYEIVVEALNNGKAVPESVHDVQFKMSGAEGKVEIAFTDKNGRTIGTFGQCVANVDTRRIQQAQIADIIIPGAARIGVSMVPLKK